MVNEEVRKKLVELGYKDSVMFDEPAYDNSIIGITKDGNLVYDYDKMADEYTNDELEDYLEVKRRLDENVMLDDDTLDDLRVEAFNFIDYNTIRSLPYCHGIKPVVIWHVPETINEYANMSGDEEVPEFEPFNL